MDKIEFRVSGRRGVCGAGRIAMEAPSEVATACSRLVSSQGGQKEEIEGRNEVGYNLLNLTLHRHICHVCPMSATYQKSATSWGPSIQTSELVRDHSQSNHSTLDGSGHS